MNVTPTPRESRYLLQDLNNQLTVENLRLKEQIRVLQARIHFLEQTLKQIANTDYRGSRSTESQIAFNALKEAP